MSIKTEKTIGFLGLGTMGFPMCYGLSKAGFRMILPAYRRSVDQAAGYSPLAKDETEKTALIDEMLKMAPWRPPPRRSFWNRWIL